MFDESDDYGSDTESFSNFMQDYVKHKIEITARTWKDMKRIKSEITGKIFVDDSEFSTSSEFEEFCIDFYNIFFLLATGPGNNLPFNKEKFYILEHMITNPRDRLITVELENEHGDRDITKILILQGEDVNVIEMGDNQMLVISIMSKDKLIKKLKKILEKKEKLVFKIFERKLMLDHVILDYIDGI